MIRFLNPQNSAKTPIPITCILLAWIFIAGLSHIRYQPPPVVSGTASTTVFSAERAEEVFQRLYENASPHPAGDNSAFRQKVIREFELLGYEVELHESQASPRNRRSSQEMIPLTNLIIRLVGKADLPPVILAGHFDSVPGAPGAADDGAAVAVIIEIARMLRNEPPLNRDLIFLLTDGEEMGLLGARQFAEEHPYATEASVVINLEARGTTGPSILFETSEDSQWLISAFAKTARRPFASSLFYEIYRRLPNDTDFTVFRNRGLRGCNFAFIGDVKNYHTIHDNFENLDRRSLQHHGENSLNLLREIMNSDIESAPNTRAVYFDVLGFRIFQWPASASIWLALLGSLSLVAFLRFCSPLKSPVEPKIGLSSRVISITAPLITLGICMGFGLALNWGLRIDGVFENPWPLSPLPVQASFWFLGLTALGGFSFLCGPRLNWRWSMLGTGLVWSALAFTTALQTPGASYLFIAPLLTTAVATWFSLWPSDTGLYQKAAFVSCVMALSAGLIWLPLERLFYDAVGFRMNFVLIIRVGLLTSVLIPLVALTPIKTVTRLTCLSFLVWICLVAWGTLSN